MTLSISKRTLKARRNLIAEIEKSSSCSSQSSDRSETPGLYAPVSKVNWVSAVTRVLASIYLHKRGIFPDWLFDCSNTVRDGVDGFPVLHRASSRASAERVLKVLNSLPALIHEKRIKNLSLAMSNGRSIYAAEKFKILFTYNQDGVVANLSIGKNNNPQRMTDENIRALIHDFTMMLKRLRPLPSDCALNILAAVTEEKGLTETGRERFMREHGFEFRQDIADALKTPALVMPEWGEIGDSSGEMTMDVCLASVFQSDEDDEDEDCE